MKWLERLLGRAKPDFSQVEELQKESKTPADVPPKTQPSFDSPFYSLKVSCTNCGATISSATFSANKGLCNPCAKGPEVAERRRQIRILQESKALEIEKNQRVIVQNEQKISPEFIHQQAADQIQIHEGHPAQKENVSESDTARGNNSITTIPWNVIYQKLNRFYHINIYDHSDLDQRIRLMCPNCNSTYFPSELLNAPVMGVLGGALILPDMTAKSRSVAKLSANRPDLWNCPECQNVEIAVAWTGPSLEAYRLNLILQDGQTGLSPSSQASSLLAFDPGDNSSGDMPVTFLPGSDVLAFPGYFSVVLWDALTNKKMEIKYDQKDMSCDSVNVLCSQSGENLFLVGSGFEGASEKHTTWLRGFTERVEVLHVAYGSAWPKVADLSSDGARIAIGMEDGAVLLVTAKDGAIVMKKQSGYGKPITGIAFSQDGKSFLTGDETGLSLYGSDLSSVKRLMDSPISRIHKIPASKLAFVMGEATISLWDATQGIKLHEFATSNKIGSLWSSDNVALSNDGRFVAQNRNRLEIFDIGLDESAVSIDLGKQAEGAETEAFSAAGGLICLVDQLSKDKWIWRIGLTL